ncbi:MAG: leucine-rich repeat domain-containing protein [Treponema sp.]|nr:leucine-rich repeat domain-containing protein [Treponema sp.]
MKTKQTFVCGYFAVMFILVFGACSKERTESAQSRGADGSSAVQEQRLTGPTDSFRFTVINSGTAYSVSAGTATEGTVNIPAYYRPNADSEYLPVTKIGNEAFKGNKNILRITIPSTVTEIEYNTFAYCTNLTSIIIPASVTAVGGYTFYGWTTSQTINIEGHASEASADAAWGSGEYNWRGSSNARIVYQGQ